jgi:uroporphyrinogen-III synthase
VTADGAAVPVGDPTGADAAVGAADPAAAPLTGFTVAVTAARRREELATLLERRGARTVTAPAIRIVPLADDTELLAATRACLAARLDVVVATTGIGFRGWMEAADGWGLGEALRARLSTTQLLARGPKARGAVRAVGLGESWSPPSESSAEVLAYLLRHDLAGRTIVVQQHGEPVPDFVEALREAGADVLEVPVYRWARPADEEPLRRLVGSVLNGAVDAVTFTSAPAAVSLLGVAHEQHVLDRVLDALRTDVLAACVGPVTAAPLERAGVPVVQPGRSRVGDLVRCVVDELPRRSRTVAVAGRSLEVRGHAVLLDGRPCLLAPAPLAVLRTLAAQPGRVCSRLDLLAALPGGEQNGEHAVEMAVARARAALGDRRLIETVVKRGYRLAGAVAKAS